MSWIYQQALATINERNQTLECKMQIMANRLPGPRVPTQERYWPLWNARSRMTAVHRQERLVQLLRIRLDRLMEDTMNASEEYNRVRWKLIRPDGPIHKTDAKPDLHEPTTARTSHIMINSKMAQLRNGLLELFNKLERKEISPAVATEMNNAAGKVISSAKVELEYRTAQLRNKELVIEFMEAEKK